MPIEVVCPECDRSLRVRDELEGKKVVCPGCRGSFVVRPPVVVEPEEEPRPRRGREAGEGERPAPGRRAGPDRPERRRPRDEDEEYDRPARRAQKGSPVVLIVLLLVGFFVLAGAGVGGFFVYRAV